MPKSQHERYVSVLTKQTMALVLAGGRGSRLKQLTDWRAKPSVHFGGKFRIIDFPLSNCINSGIRRIAVLTQYKADSMIKHLINGWSFLRGEFGEFIDIIPAQQRTGQDWYLGTADAVYQNIDIIRNRAPEYIVILAGDHVYKMDYGQMIAYHVDNQADLTIGCLEVSLEEAKGFGVMHVEEDNMVKAFVEKPDNPPSIPGRDDIALASMGIYVFNAAFLYEQLIIDAETPDSTRDFGSDIIPSIIEKHRVYAYPFLNIQTGGQAYWRDVGTIDSYWQANMELVSVDPEMNLYDQTWPIWTYQAQNAPAKFVFDDEDRRGMAVDSMVSGGVIISGSVVRRSLVFSDVKVNSYGLVEDSVILPKVNIGRHSVIKKAIIDKGCKIPQGTIIGENLEKDAEQFYVSPGGVVLVTPEMLGQEIHKADWSDEQLA